MAAEVFRVEKPQLGSALAGVRSPGEQRRETRERSQPDVLPGADIVVDAQAGLGVKAASQPRAAAVEPAGQLLAVVVAGPGHVG